VGGLFSKSAPTKNTVEFTFYYQPAVMRQPKYDFASSSKRGAASSLSLSPLTEIPEDGKRLHSDAASTIKTEKGYKISKSLIKWG
jgi:hypothetical protein